MDPATIQVILIGAAGDAAGGLIAAILSKLRAEFLFVGRVAGHCSPQLQQTVTR